jgi:peptide/nickel transport system ATP-binding protein
VQAEALNLLEALRAQRRPELPHGRATTCAVVTHLCGRMMVMQRGRTVEVLPAAELAAGRAQAACTHGLIEAARGFSRRAA